MTINDWTFLLSGFTIGASLVNITWLVTMNARRGR